MTSTAPHFEWYLARGGQQYGPLSDVELKKFVDLGHLKPDDLVWRQGFTEWLPASTVFPPAPRPAQPAPAARPASQQGPTQLAARSPAAAPPRSPMGQDRAAQPARTSAASGYRDDPATMHRPAQSQRTQTAAPLGPVRGPELAMGQPAAAQPRDRAPDPVRTGRPNEAGPAQSGRPARPVSAQGTGLAVSTSGRDEPSSASGNTARRLGIVAVIAAVVLAVGGGGWFALHSVDFASIVPKELFSRIGGSSGGDLSASPLKTAGDTVEAIDSSFQQTALWRVIKRVFPDWYGERLQDAQKLKAENRDEAAVAKSLSEGLVALRRKHAAKALAASPKRLVAVAQSFLDNLDALSKHSTEACYGFISNGETNPIVLNLMLGSKLTAPLQHQVTSVFEAISEGTQSPQNYLPPRKTDYDLLAQELTARGWSQADLQLFSDPRALSRASPGQVCKMVQDWFAAQIAIKDAEVQTRLLVESLRPVVAG